jgi:hypothetical protein
MTVLVIPGRAPETRDARLDGREPGISRNNLRIPGSRLRLAPE